MLTLTQPLTIRGYTIFRDDVSQFQFYVLPEKPRVVTENRNGAIVPVFSLIVYRQDEDRVRNPDPSKDVGGGIMTFTAELSVPDEEMRRLEREVRAKVFPELDPDEPGTQVTLSYVPFLEGKVRIALAGETAETGPDNEFVRSEVGTGKVSGIGKNRKAVMVKLSQAGAALFSQLDRLPTLPINIEYDLSYEHRLKGVTMRVWSNATSSYTLTKTFLTVEYTDYDGYDEERDRRTIDRLTENLVRNHAMGVEVTPHSSEVDEESLMALEKFGFDMLNREIERLVQAGPPAQELRDSTFDLSSYVSTASNTLNFTLDRTMVLTRPHLASANLDNVFQGRPADFITFVDLRTGFFSWLEVPIRVNANFERLPIHSVNATVFYERRRIGTGEREEVSDTFNFTDPSGIQTFRAFANRLEDLSYRWQAEVHFKDGSPTLTTELSEPRKDTFLVVDAASVGILDVDVGLGTVDLEKFPRAVVTLRVESRKLRQTLEKSFVLKEGTESVWWVEVTHDRENEYEYQTQWMRADGTSITDPWRRSSSSRLRLAAPTPDRMSVTVVPSGDFKKDVEQVLCGLRYRDEANNYFVENSFTFRDSKEVQTWAVDLVDPALRSYEYRYEVIYKNGLIESHPEDRSAWLPGEPGFITVGVKYLFEVELNPILLSAYPEWATLVKVELSYEDTANDIALQDSFVFSKDANTAQVWRVKGAQGGPREYTVRTVYYDSQGEEYATEPLRTTMDSFVIKPRKRPEPPTPPTPPTPPVP